MIERREAGLRRAIGSPRVQVVAATLLAGVLRMIALTGPVLRWDEGWTIAHASLPWSQLLEVAANEWHPPLYYLLMKLWLAVGPSPLAVRYLSVLLGVLLVPVAYHAGRLWDGGRARTGVYAAVLCAWAPLLVYYGQVARMYTLATLFVSAAVVLVMRVAGVGDQAAGSRQQASGIGQPPQQHGASQAVVEPRNRTGAGGEPAAPRVERPGTRHLPSRCLLPAACCLFTFLAVFTQYYAVWPLAAAYLYAALARPRRAPALVAVGAGAVALFVPWLVYAYPALTGRLATGAGRGVDPLAGTLAKLPLTLDGLLFYNGAGPYAPAALALLVVLMIGLSLRRPRELGRLALPALATLFPLIGISYGAQASGWAAPHRHVMLAAPVALLALAWALERLAARGPVLPLAGLALAVAVYWPTSAVYVYAKNLEVVDPFDPGIDQAYLHGRARGDELVFFNVLARAGWYESRRAPGDPPWSYAMRWDPIIEPMDVIAARVQAAAATHPRLWFVMHEGAYGPNAELVDWLDANLYPASAEWRTEPPMTHTLYLSYVAPQGPWTVPDAPRAVGPVTLTRARYTAAGGAVAVELAWTAPAAVPADYTVYVHWLDDGGALVAQHDGVPAAGRRPVSTWQPGEVILDRHGARVPEGRQGRLHIIIGWYNPVSGEQIGSPVELGTVVVPGIPESR